MGATFAVKDHGLWVIMGETDSIVMRNAESNKLLFIEQCRSSNNTSHDSIMRRQGYTNEISLEDLLVIQSVHAFDSGCRMEECLTSQPTMRLHYRDIEDVREKMTHSKVSL